MQTKAADLMELFVRLFDTSNDAAPDSPPSTLMSPMPELAAPPVPLTEMLSSDGSVLTKMLEDYASRTAPELAKEFAELSALVANNKQDLDLDQKHAKRLLEFVYPVV